MSKSEYKRLLDRYEEMFMLFDKVHFNSSVSEGVYKRCLSIDNSEIIHITHSGVEDRRVVRGFESERLKFIFIGSTSEYKGFPLLEEVLKELWTQGMQCWELNVWGAQGHSECEAIHFRGNFNYEQQAVVFEDDALLLVPSLCNETFGLTVLEALSYGTPAMVSSTVGAKDLVEEYDPWFVFRDRDELKDKLSELLKNRDKLRGYSDMICQKKWCHSIENHSQEIIKMYKR